MEKEKEVNDYVIGTWSMILNQSAVGTFRSKVNNERIYTKVRGKDRVN